MPDVLCEDEAWKSAWIEFLIEMVALDSEASPRGGGTQAAHRVFQEAAEIERSIDKM